MRILVFGIKGQIGQALEEAAQRRGWEAFGPSHADVDICDRGAVADVLRSYGPAALVNAAGYTAVDQAESDVDQAFRTNRDGARILAEAASVARVPIVHLSTDYVFDGLAHAPYIETDPVGPLSVYARSKEEGECAVKSATGRHVILRTAWVYSPFGTNFLRTMLRLGSERPELSVVDDQTGCPTSAFEVADAIVKVLAAAEAPGFDAWGTYHCVGANAITWHGFAKAIFDSAARFHFIVPRLRAVATAEYPRPARRPPYSVLSTAKLERNFGLRPRPLPDGLTECLKRLRGNGDNA